MIYTGEKISRRVFLKTLGVYASILLFSKIFPKDKVLAKAANLINRMIANQEGLIHIVWIQSQSCSGCSVSLLNSTDPSIVDVLLGQFKGVKEVSLDFHPTLSPQWGIDVVSGSKGAIATEWDALAILEKAKNGELGTFILVTEGAFPDESRAGNGYWSSLGSAGGQPIKATDWLREAAQHAAVVVAIGTCATFGGIPSGYPNPTGAMGTIEVLGKDYKSALGLPVINVPGCPPGGDWQVKTFAHLLLTVKNLLPPPELDEYNRPKFLYGRTVHERCGRGVWYSASKFSEKYGEPYCMYALGCKGPIVKCPMPVLPFVEGVGICTNYGSPCIGCTDPAFPDAPLSPFLKALPQPTLPVTSAAAIAAAAGAVLGSLVTYRVRKAKKSLKEKEGESK